MDYKKLAEQAGISFGGHPMNPLSVYFSELKRFAELILEQERKEAAEHYLKLIRDCVATEREACAKIVDENLFLLVAAAAIRARGEQA